MCNLVGGCLGTIVCAIVLLVLVCLLGPAALILGVFFLGIIGGLFQSTRRF